MALIVGFRVDPETVEIGQVLVSDEVDEVELESIVGLDDRSIPLFWVSVPDEDRFLELVQEDDAVTGIERLEATDGQVLYAVEWEEGSEHLPSLVEEVGGKILSARGTDEEVDVEIQFDRSDCLPTFHEACDGAGIEVEIDRKYNPSRPDSGPWFGLTDPQWEALSLALEHGYFEIPRRCTVADLAEQLDISDQAMSERIRRAMGALVRNTMAMSDRSDRSG